MYIYTSMTAPEFIAALNDDVGEWERQGYSYNNALKLAYAGAVLRFEEAGIVAKGSFDLEQILNIETISPRATYQ